jgi:hypothetical protein
MPDTLQPSFPSKLNVAIRTKKKAVLSILIILGLLFIGWMFFGDRVGQDGKLYAQVAGHKIYEQDVKDLIGNNENINDHDAAKVLADKYLTEELGEEQGVSLSSKEIVAEYGDSIKAQENNNKFAYQNKVNKLYFKKLADYYQGSYKGKLLVAHFSRNIALKTPLLKEQKMLNKTLGDPTAIARDRKYAKNFITSLYDQIQSKQISFDEAIKREHQDSVVGKRAYMALPHSGVFDTSKPLDTNGLIESLGVKDQINSIKSGQTSEPFVVKITGVAENDSSAESYFLVVRMDHASGGQNNMSFSQYLEQSKRKLVYEIYV